jgi:hypothetical protein
VFDGAVAGFDLVGTPSLLISENGFLNIIWKEQSIQGDGAPQPLSLYYTRSEDGGRTFSDAQLIVEESVTWREMVTDDSGNLHLLWQAQDTLTTVWDQVSLDGGRTWQIPQGLPDEGTTAAITVDSIGRLHLVDAGSGSLGHWLWNGSRWQPETPLRWSLPSQQKGTVDLLAAAVNKQGKMVVVLAVPTSGGNAAEKSILYSTRTLELPRTQTATENAPTPTRLPTTVATVVPATSTPEYSLTPVTTVEGEPTNPQGKTDRNESNDSISPVTIALLPVALLLLSVLGIAIRRSIRDQDR